MTYEELYADPAFIELREYPWVFQFALVNSPDDPKSYLRNVQNQFGNLIAREEMADFRIKHDIVYGAIVQQQDPGEFLRNIIHQTDEIIAEEEFKQYEQCRWRPISAIFALPQDPRGLLRRWEQTLREIYKELEEKGISLPRWLVNKSMVMDTEDPRRWLYAQLQLMAEILSEEEFAWTFRNLGGVLWAVAYEADPRGYLRRVLAGDDVGKPR